MIKPGGHVAIADLEKEDGLFHSANPSGVEHSGFERNAVGSDFSKAGFKNIRFTNAYNVKREGREYPIFLMTGEK